MTTYCMLAETGQLGPDTTGRHPDGDPYLITTGPRRLVPSEVIGEDPHHVLIPLLSTAYCIATLEPKGPVTLNDDDLPECADGWKVASLSGDLAPMTGPQAAQIRAVVAEAERVLIGNWDGAQAVAYAQAIDAVYDHGYPQAEQLACEALDAIGADGFWWSGIGACAYGGEVKALAARDLIGTIPGWTQEAYDLLTGPWAAAFGRPAHPDDTIPGHAGDATTGGVNQP
jgi:hypothetical protein